MSTHRHTATVVKDVRSWLDFDQKFLGAFVALLATIAVTAVELAQHGITWEIAGGQVGPVAVAAGLAYAATSKHREVIDHTADTVRATVDEAAPIVEAAVPAVAAEVRVVVDGVDEITKRIDAGMEDFTTPAAAGAVRGA